MTRRNFLALGTTGAALLAASALVVRSQLQFVYRKVKGRFLPEQPAVQAALLTGAELPPEGERVSVELALNSRCSSDRDGDQEVFHWGMFNPSVRLSAEQVSRIADLAGGLHLSKDANDIVIQDDVLTFRVNKRSTSRESIDYMIGSGLQQQAVCLVCAALGAGLMFNAQGPDGTSLSPEHLAAVKMKLGGMVPSYKGSYWTAAAPEQERPWLPGNLPEPKRNGSVPLLATLAKLNCEHATGKDASLDDLGQLLWAARGRSPHLYKSSAWGLTIPTWQGLQNISAVQVVSGETVYRYANWRSSRPTHSLEVLEDNLRLSRELQERFTPDNLFMVLSTNENYARALWEVGYQLLNITLQATASGVAFRTVILDERDRALFQGTKLGNCVAMVCLRTQGFALSKV